MTCEELLMAMNEYVDGRLEPGMCEEFARHLSGCNPCQVVVDNIRGTIQLYKDGQPYELPPEFQDRLRGMLRQRWEQKMGPAKADPGPASG
jgi:anti-sigma factor RsiW